MKRQGTNNNGGLKGKRLSIFTIDEDIDNEHTEDDINMSAKKSRF